MQYKRDKDGNKKSNLTVILEWLLNFRQEMRNSCDFSKLWSHVFDVLGNPPYSIALSDNHSFRLIGNSLDGKNFTSIVYFKNCPNRIFNYKLQKVYEHWIMKLPEKWRNVANRVLYKITVIFN